MKRDELRAQLEAKGIIMSAWPDVTDDGHVLVVDECGCGEDVIEVGCWPRHSQAVTAVVEWAENTYRAGGFSGGNYPDNDKLYVIFHDREVIETSLSTNFEPNFVATIRQPDHAAPVA